MKKKTFKATIVSMDPGSAWAKIDLPFSVEEAWGSRGRVSVTGTINGFEFRSSIFPNGDGTHHMMVNKQMRAGAKADVGDSVRFEMAPDTAPRTVEPPPDLAKALGKNKTAKAAFEKLSPSHQKAFVDWLLEAKREETRTRRVGKTIEMLLEGKTRW